MKKLLMTSTWLLLLVSCTDNTMARKFGGTSDFDLDPGKKLVNITWKQDQLWVLTRDLRPGEPIESYEYKEHSSFGIIEGKILINEKPRMKNEVSRYDTSANTSVFVVN